MWCNECMSYSCTCRSTGRFGLNFDLPKPFVTEFKPFKLDLPEIKPLSFYPPDDLFTSRRRSFEPIVPIFEPLRLPDPPLMRQVRNLESSMVGHIDNFGNLRDPLMRDTGLRVGMGGLVHDIHGSVVGEIDSLGTMRSSPFKF